MVGFEKALGAVKVIKDQIQYRSQSLLNLACDYFSAMLLIGNLLIEKDSTVICVPSVLEHV